MKRMTKLLLGAASVFGVVGGAFCISSFCLGFSGSDFVQVIQSGRSYATAHPSGVNFSQLTQDDIEFEQSYQGNEIDELSLDISEMECRLVPWEREEWKVTGYRLPSDFKCRESGGVLKIKSGGSQFLPWNSQKENACLEILFPESAVLNGLEIDSGVGDVLMEDGVLVCGEADVDCGIGNCALRMDVRDNLKIECGVGDVSLLLAGIETDFDYKLDCGVGDITVNKGVRMQSENTGTAGGAEHADLTAHEEDHLAEKEADHQNRGDGTVHEAEHLEEDHQSQNDNPSYEKGSPGEDEEDYQDRDNGTMQEAGYGTDVQSSGESTTYGTEYAVSGAKRKVDHDAGREVRISCGVGSVVLTFTEE